MQIKKPFKRLLTPPSFEGDDEKTSEAVILHQILLYLSAILIFATTVLLPFHFIKHKSLLIALGFFSVFILLAWYLMKKGKVRLASGLLVSGLWLSATSGLLHSNSSNSYLTARFVSITVIAGLLLGPRFSLGIALLSSASLLIIGIMDSYELLDPFEPTPLSVAWSIITILLLLSAMLVNLAQTTIKKAWSKTREELDRRRKAESETEKLQEQLVQSQKMEAVGRIAAGVAHDFNNLLTPIHGYASLMQIELSPDDRHQKWINQITFATERAKELTDQLLAFGRKQVIHPVPLDLGKVVAGYEELLRRAVRENIRIDLSAAPNLPLIMADRGQIGQILMNLAVNAQDAMPKGGILTINLEEFTVDETMIAGHSETKSGPHVLLMITDNGSGIDPDSMNLIFEPFFTTKEVGKGTGLGLATVYGIVKQHSGFINVYSEVGHGTVFKIFFPALSKEIKVEGIFSDPDQIERGKGETILIVEDNPMVRQSASDMVQQLGYRTISIDRAEKALNLIREQKPDIKLLITDVIMPGINGNELSKLLQEESPGLKTLFMSGYTGGWLSQEELLNGKITLIQKPFSIAGLSQKIKEAMRS